MAIRLQCQTKNPFTIWVHSMAGKCIGNYRQVHCVLRSFESIPAFCRWHAPHIEMHPTTHAHNHTINGRDMVSDNGHYTWNVEYTLRTRTEAERRHHYHYHCIGETNISIWFGCDHVHVVRQLTFIFNIVHPRIFKWIVLYANIVVHVVVAVCHAKTT